MIFLLKNGDVRSLDPQMSEAKVIRKFEKYKDKISAVLLEADSRLRSDTYMLISADHFRHTFKPFDIIYSCGYVGDDEPIIKENIMVRQAHIESFHDMYGLYSLLLTMEKCNEMTYVLGFIRYPVLLSVQIIEDGEEKDLWTSDMCEKLVEFFEVNQIIIDTDDFMDASLPEKDRVEAGHYYVRYVTLEDGLHEEYYKYARKSYLYMRDDCWALDTMDPRFYQETYDVGKGASDPIKRQMMDGLFPILVGICITGTGLLHVSHIDISGWFVQITAIDITVHCKAGDNYAMEMPEGVSFTASGANTLDALYLALFIPQLLDFGRFLYQEDPRDLCVELLFNKLQGKDGVMEFPEWKEGTGIELDLFYFIAKTMVNAPLRTLTSDD